MDENLRLLKLRMQNHLLMYHDVDSMDINDEIRQKLHFAGPAHLFYTVANITDFNKHNKNAFIFNLVEQLFDQRKDLFNELLLSHTILINELHHCHHESYSLALESFNTNHFTMLKNTSYTQAYFYFQCTVAHYGMVSLGIVSFYSTIENGILKNWKNIRDASQAYMFSNILSALNEVYHY